MRHAVASERRGHPRPRGGEGSAVDKFRVSGTQETVEGAGANEVSGVLSEASCCRCGAPLIKKQDFVKCLKINSLQSLVVPRTGLEPVQPLRAKGFSYCYDFRHRLCRL